jgi:hypothetical protein
VAQAIVTNIFLCVPAPQGAFVLLSSTGSVSIVILLIMMAALAAYITWRFWEGLAGQGYDET